MIYVVYDRAEQKTRISQDIGVVKEEIMDYLIAYMKYYVNDIQVNLEAFQNDLEKRNIGARDISMIDKQKELLDKIADCIIAYIRMETANDFEKILSSIDNVLAVEDFRESLKDEIEMLVSHEEHEKAELLKKCQKPVWVGFDRTDEYGSIICEVE